MPEELEPSDFTSTFRVLSQAEEWAEEADSEEIAQTIRYCRRLVRAYAMYHLNSNRWSEVPGLKQE